MEEPPGFKWQRVFKRSMVCSIASGRCCATTRHKTGFILQRPPGTKERVYTGTLSQGPSCSCLFSAPAAYHRASISGPARSFAHGHSRTTTDLLAPTMTGLDDVPDSTDWLATPVPGLGAVESALRCQICKDFYTTPMLTSCNHTFCSICIRRALAHDGKCPLCRASEQESKLRSNWSMEEVVGAFAKTRKALLDFTKQPPIAMASNAGSLTPKRRPDDDSLEEDQNRQSKRLRSSTRASKTRGAERTCEVARQEIDFAPYSEADGEFKDGLVQCPICLARMKEAQVSRHLDTGSCPGPPQPQTLDSSALASFPTGPALQSNSAPKPRPERISSLNYSMLKESQLRKRLADQGIPSGGSRAMAEKRHMEWVTIWNANCDSLNPRKKTELLQDLDVWERTLGSRAPTSSRSLHVGAQIKDKDFDHAGWSSKHDASFKDLIAKARKNKNQALQPSKENQAADGTPTPTTASEASEAICTPGRPIHDAVEMMAGDANPDTMVLPSRMDRV